MKPLWARIHAWLDEHAPQVRMALAPGATAERIAAVFGVEVAAVSVDGAMVPVPSRAI